MFASFTIHYVLTIIYNCNQQCTLGYLLSLQSVLAMFHTKDLLIYFSLPRYYRGLRPHRRGVVINVNPIPTTTAVFILIQTPITRYIRGYTVESAVHPSIPSPCRSLKLQRYVRNNLNFIYHRNHSLDGDHGGITGTLLKNVNLVSANILKTNYILPLSAVFLLLIRIN